MTPLIDAYFINLGLNIVKHYILQVLNLKYCQNTAHLKKFFIWF